MEMLAKHITIRMVLHLHCFDTEVTDNSEVAYLDSGKGWGGGGKGRALESQLSIATSDTPIPHSVSSSAHRQTWSHTKYSTDGFFSGTW